LLPSLADQEAWKTRWKWFGYSVDVDGDLACVVAAISGEVYIFERDDGDDDTTGGSWAQMDKLIFEDWIVTECLIAGNTLAVQTLDLQSGIFDNLQLYVYNEDTDKFVFLQSVFPADGAKVLSRDYLIFSTSYTSPPSNRTVYDGVHIYNRQSERDPFTLLQFLNASKYDPMFGARLALDKDVLVVHSNNATIFFSERDGYWEEALVFDAAYLSYQISGRNVMVTGHDKHGNKDASASEDMVHDIFAFSLDDCIQQKMPTQFPSLTMATTPPASAVPCYEINVTVTFHLFPGHTSWDIKKDLGESGSGSSVIIKSYQGAWNDLSETRSWSICLQEGQYKFTIYDSEGNYSVTSGDRVIATGNEFGDSHVTSFPMPYDLAPSTMSSTSHVPPATLSPTVSPTVTCYLTEVSIWPDKYPDETEWSISKVSTINGRNELNVASDNRPITDFVVDGRSYTAVHMRNSAIDTSAAGMLCDCGLGRIQCKCQGQICLIKRGDNFFSDKVQNCEVGGGVAAVIYNNGVETSAAYTLSPYTAVIPAIFITEADGQYLLENGLGQSASIAASSQPLPLAQDTLNVVSMCLPEGRYQFTIIDSGNNGICCGNGDGEYNIATGGKIVVQGKGDFGSNETNLFNIP